MKLLILPPRFGKSLRMSYEIMSSMVMKDIWEDFWQETRSTFGNSGYKRRRYLLMAEFNARGLLKLLKDKKITSLLELGGGGGCLAKSLAQKLGLKSQAVVLIDISREGKKAWQQFSGFGQFILGDLFTYNFGKQKYDLVLSNGLIEHWSSKSERIKLIKKHALLAKKYVLIQVPKKGWFMSLFRYNRLVVRLLAMMKKIAGFEKLYTAKELKKEITEAGLKIIEFKEGVNSLTVLVKASQK